MSRPVFLAAAWRHLCVVNFAVNPDILQPHLPFGTELDFYRGRTYVSLVAFMFYRTKAFGIVPAFFHDTFEEINLRFYVLRKEPSSIKRGVVFVKEVVPKKTLAWVARRFYGENYVAMKTWSHIQQGETYNYGWGPHRLKVSTNGECLRPAEDSLERWITEHYWGYTKINGQRTHEYEVKHPVWELYKTENHELSGDFADLYGQEFKDTLTAPPSSLILADGSDVTVHFPTALQA